MFFGYFEGSARFTECVLVVLFEMYVLLDVFGLFCRRCMFYLMFFDYFAEMYVLHEVLLLFCMFMKRSDYGLRLL